MLQVQKSSASTESTDSDIKIQQRVTILIGILEICYNISNSNKAKRQQYFTSRCCGVSNLSLDNSLNMKLWYTKCQHLELWGGMLHCSNECSLNRTSSILQSVSKNIHHICKPRGQSQLSLSPRHQSWPGGSPALNHYILKPKLRAETLSKLIFHSQTTVFYNSSPYPQIPASVSHHCRYNWPQATDWSSKSASCLWPKPLWH